MFRYNRITTLLKPVHKITISLCDSIVLIGGERTEMSELIEEERGAEGRKGEQGGEEKHCSARCRIRARPILEIASIKHSLMFFGATVLRNGTGYLVVFQIFNIHP